jgi:tetratricopeptide (TPR) repeat protein
MPLNTFFIEQMDGIRQFLQSPDKTVLILQHDPDVDRIIQKILIRLDEDDGNPAVMVRSRAVYDNHPQFFGDLLQELVEQNENHRDELAGLDIELPRPEDVSEDDPAYEVFNRYVSEVADCLPNTVGSYVVVLDPDEIKHAEGFRNAVEFLAENTTSEWVKYVLFDSRTDPILDELHEQCDRVLLQVFHLPPEEIELRVKEDLASGKLDPKETRMYTAMVGAFAFANKDYQQALKVQQDVLQMSRDDDVPAEEAQALYNLGNTYLSDGKLEQAEEALAQAALIASDEKMDALAAMAMTNLAVALQRQGRIDESLQAFDAAHSTFAALNHRPGEIHVLDNKAAALALEGRHEEAEAAWREALALCDSITAPHFQKLRESASQDILAKLKRFFESTHQHAKIDSLPQQESAVS